MHHSRLRLASVPVSLFQRQTQTFTRVNQAHQESEPWTNAVSKFVVWTEPSTKWACQSNIIPAGAPAHRGGGRSYRVHFFLFAFRPTSNSFLETCWQLFMKTSKFNPFNISSVIVFILFKYYVILNCRNAFYKCECIYRIRAIVQMYNYFFIINIHFFVVHSWYSLWAVTRCGRLLLHTCPVKWLSETRWRWAPTQTHCFSICSDLVVLAPPRVISLLSHRFTPGTVMGNHLAGGTPRSEWWLDG